MPRIVAQLESTALARAEYDTDTSTLDITFVNGRTYTCENFPQKLFEELRDTQSPGQFFNRYIKDQY